MECHFTYFPCLPPSPCLRGRGNWLINKSNQGIRQHLHPLSLLHHFASTFAFLPLPPRPPVLPLTFLPPLTLTAALPHLYPAVPPTRADCPTPRVFRGSPARAVSRPSTPYRCPPTPQLVQDLLDQVGTLQRHRTQSVYTFTDFCPQPRLAPHHFT